MKKNGFTLIELLAVIVVLAIIGAIATTVISGARASTLENEYKYLEKEITDLGPAIYSHESIMNQEGSFMIEYKNLDNNGSFYVSLNTLHAARYLEDLKRINDSYRLVDPGKGEYCDGFLLVTKTDAGPKFKGFIECDNYKTDNTFSKPNKEVIL